MEQAPIFSSFSGQPARIAVFRALQLGDMLCSVPAFRALRKALPQAEITLISLPWAADFATRFSAYVDRFLPFPGHPSLPEQKSSLRKYHQFLSLIRQEPSDLLIQMHGSGSLTNTLSQQFGAHKLAGYFPEQTSPPDKQSFMPYPSTLHETQRHLKLMRFLGAKETSPELEFPLSTEEQREASTLFKKYTLIPQQYICIHPGSRATERRWSVENFASVANSLAPYGFQLVVTGSAAEKNLADKLSSLIHAPVRNLAGQTSLGSLALLIKQARLVIANDTGVSHLAAALQTPSVIIFSTSDPQRWAPLKRNLHKIVLSHNPYSVQTVFNSARDVLKQTSSPSFFSERTVIT